jgi:hypothetical protein
MAVTLNANTSTGFIATSDTSGVLQLQTGGTAAVTVDASQNVGIGTASPTSRLTVSGSADLVADLNSTNASGGYMVWRTNSTVIADLGTAQNIFGTGGSDTFGINARSTRPLLFGTNNTERMRINSGAPILCLAGGSTSATGTGIAFPATQSASSDVNTLDDYEEGTWTPVFNAGGITGTSITYSGTYTKIGRVVTVNFYAYSASGNINVSSYVVFSGAPFSASNLGSGAVTSEDIDIFASLGFANAAGTGFGLSKCGNGTSSYLYATVTIFV